MSATVCARHPGAAARSVCGRCGRSVCLTCAVPVRGAIRCVECVREELGDDVPADPRARAPRLSPWAGALFLLATGLAMLPWDSNGDRIEWFSALSLRPDPWPLIASALLALAGVLSFRATTPGRRPVGHLVVGGLGVVAVLVAVPAPDFATRTLVPYLVLALGAFGVSAAVVQRARAGRIRDTSAP